MTRLLLLSFCFAGAASAQDWQVVWADEFDVDGAPDPTKWDYDIGGHGWGNSERQYYTDRTENARVEGGVLVIEAREEAYEGNAYTSARLVTRGKAAWRYGRIEARMKLPYGQGIWPAFWMLPTDSPYGGWPASGEIDIMEYLGHDTDRTYGTLHYGGGSLGHRYTGTHYNLPSGTFDADFHTFAIEWEPRRIRWYVDGHLYQTQTTWSTSEAPFPAPFDQPFHLLLNVAVGGQWPGYPDATTTFPQRMEVDYVRVYQDLEAYPEVTVTAPATAETGATIALAADVTDNDEIAEVRFLQDGGVLGADIFAPYGLNVADVADGCYAVRAQATDAVGYVSVSDPVEVVVGAGCPEGTAWPYLMRPQAIPGKVEAEYYDLGGNGVAYRELGLANSGAGIRPNEGVDTRPSKDDGGDDVTDTSAREWMAYSVEVAQAGRYRIVGRHASTSDGAIKLSLDGTDLMGEVTLASSGGDIRYATPVLGEVLLPEGQHTLRLDVVRGGFSLNWLNFVYLGPSAAEGPAERGGGDLQLAPNPAASRTEVTFRMARPGPVEVAMFDAVGRRVLVVVRDVGAGEVSIGIDLGALAPGAYTCRVATADGVVARSLAIAR